MTNKQTKTIIIDLEGTLSDDAHRQDLRSMGDYQAYAEAIDHDEPNDFLVNMIEVLSEFYDICVIGNSNERYRTQIEAWLYDNGVMADQVILRPDDCYESEVDWKIFVIDETFELDNVAVIIDDDERVCDAVRAAGLFTMMV